MIPRARSRYVGCHDKTLTRQAMSCNNKPIVSKTKNWENGERYLRYGPQSPKGPHRALAVGVVEDLWTEQARPRSPQHLLCKVCRQIRITAGRPRPLDPGPWALGGLGPMMAAPVERAENDGHGTAHRPAFGSDVWTEGAPPASDGRRPSNGEPGSCSLLIKVNLNCPRPLAESDGHRNYSSPPRKIPTARRQESAHNAWSKICGSSPRRAKLVLENCLTVSRRGECQQHCR